VHAASFGQLTKTGINRAVLRVHNHGFQIMKEPSLIYNHNSQNNSTALGGYLTPTLVM
jgi:hypothetical protein